MANYGITALSGLSGALDRQDQRNEVKDQRAWRDESRGQQRKQWDRADKEFAAGAENKGLAQKNQKMKLLVESADLERIRSIQELMPVFQTIERSRKSGGDRNELGESMAKILSKANAKGIKYVPYDGHGQDNTGETDFKFQSEDGKTYGFRNFQEAYDSIGESFANGENFLKTRQEALNERGIYKLEDGSFKEMTRGEAERVGAVPLAAVRAQEQSETTKRQNAGTYGGTFTDADGTMKAINNRTGKTINVGNHYTSPADQFDVESKKTKQTTDKIKQYVSTVNGLLIPFKGKESGSMPMFDEDGMPTVVAENAYKKAQDYLTETLERNEPLTQRDYNDLKTAQAAINAFEEFKVFIAGSGQNNQSRGGGVATGGKLNVGKYKIANPEGVGGVPPAPGIDGGQPQKAISGSYGDRADGTQKGRGYFGELERPDGNISTELSIGVSFDGQETEIPLLVPTLSSEEVEYLLSGKEATKEIVKKAVDHAKLRMRDGKSPFADDDSASKPKQTTAMGQQTQPPDFGNSSLAELRGMSMTQSKNAYGLPETYQASTSALTGLQKFASGTGVGQAIERNTGGLRDNPPKFGEGPIEQALRLVGATSNLSEQKEIASKLQRQYPNATEDEIAKAIMEVPQED